MKLLVLWGGLLLLVELFAVFAYGCGGVPPTCMSDVKEDGSLSESWAGCGPCGNCVAAVPTATVTHTSGK